MGKRSNFERNPRDLYDTPYKAVEPLLPFLESGTRYAEPCFGNGKLRDALAQNGHIAQFKSDIHPVCLGVYQENALLRESPYPNVDCIITNPPWDRKLLHPMITRFINNAPYCWLLFDADWWHTKQAIPFKPYCQAVVSVGRVKWIEGSKSTGKDNCAWYKFSKEIVPYAKLY